jgi:hypothetical protein
MNPETLVAKLPVISGWIDKTLAEHAAQARSVASLGFARLPQYYPVGLLARAKIIPVAKVPTPPLTQMGLPEFADFENMTPRGITYKDTYFVQESQIANESLHFHELVHVVQWAYYGVEPSGLSTHGYANSPLEKMAYGLQNYFDQNGKPGNIEAFILAELKKNTSPPAA